MQQWRYSDGDDNNDVKHNTIIDGNGIMGVTTAMTEVSSVVKEA